MLLCACDTNEPVQQTAMPISICLPAGEVYAAQAPAQRAFGDPGTTEQFALPKYLYIYIVKYKGTGEKPTNWKVWQVITKSVEDADLGATKEAKKAAWDAKWEKKRYTGAYSNVGDSIFQYTEQIILLIGDNGFDGRVYAVASAVPMTLPTIIPESSTLADVLGMQFSFGIDAADFANPNSVVNNLQNIYSTPYNYQPDGEHYYGSFYSTQKVPHLTLLLYHMAAKVDLMWNVKEDIRSSVKISYIAAENLYNGPCYVFRPTENIIADAAYGSGYTREIMSTRSPGTQWNGRAYFYAIPYRNNNSATGVYPLQLRLLKNGDASANPAGATSYYSKVVNTTVPNVWTSWIRGQITINTADYNYPTP